jgi:hypothetical protein
MRSLSRFLFLNSDSTLPILFRDSSGMRILKRLNHLSGALREYVPLFRANSSLAALKIPTQAALLLHHLQQRSTVWVINRWGGVGNATFKH